MDYCYKHPNRNNIRIFTQNPNWKDHPLELAFMNEALCLDFTQWEMFQTPLMSACKRGSVRKLYRCITCLKGPQAQLTLWLKPTAFGLFTEILQGLAYGPRKEVCICWGPCLPPGSLPKGNSSASSSPLTRWGDRLSFHTASTRSLPTPPYPRSIEARPTSDVILLPSFCSSAPAQLRRWALAGLCEVLTMGWSVL